MDAIPDHVSSSSSSSSSSAAAAAGTAVKVESPKKPVPRLDASIIACHGTLNGNRAQETWKRPRMAVSCASDARPGYNTRKAHEYLDEDDVLRAKCKFVARLVRQSKKAVAYTGAGISTASGISDYASKSDASLAKKRPTLRSHYDAQPTLAHRCLVSMFRAGQLQHWIQQNHDGLPQKAGMPQEHINEIHGSWYDPSNPVVPMTGRLRGDLLSWLMAWEHQADLCLTLGTSVCGMNSDRMAASVAQRASAGQALGTVLVGLQQTQLDAQATVRVFATIDRFMTVLMEELDLAIPAMPCPSYKPLVHRSAIPEGAPADVFMLPYDCEGQRLQGKTQRRMLLSLRVGDKVRLTIGKHKGDIGEVIKKNREGHYVFIFQHKLKRKSKLTHPMQRVMGSWWLAGASRGVFAQLPIVNLKPVEVKAVAAAANHVTASAAASAGGATAAPVSALMTASKGCFNVQPLKHCPHLPTTFAPLAAIRKSAESNRCSVCKCEVDNWICLGTANVGCGRHQLGHAKQHATVTGHSVCLCLEDLSIWCYKCDGYLDQFTIEALRQPFAVVHKAKFGTAPALPSSSNTVDFCLRLEKIDTDDVSKS